MILPPRTRKTWTILFSNCALVCLSLGPISSAKAQETKQETLKPQVQAIIVEFLKLKRDVFQTLGKSEAEIRDLVRTEAVKKYWAALDRLIPADGKVPLNELDQAGVDAILAEVFREPTSRPPVPERNKPDSVPPPPEPSNPQALSDRIAADFPIIARAVKNEDANLRGEAGMTAELRRSRLLQYTLSLFARAADVSSADPKNLTEPEKAQAGRLVDDLIAGKSIVAIKAPDSRLSNEVLKGLLEAIASKNRQLMLAGSDPKSLNHRDQLIEFAKTRVAKDAPGDLKPAEIAEIDNLVDQVRFNAINSLPTTVQPTSKPAKETLSQEIRDRLIGLARAVNQGLNAVGLDPATRKKILLKFVFEQLARLLGLGPVETLAADFTPEAEAIVNRVIDDAPTTNPNQPIVVPTTIMTQPLLIDPGTIPGNLFWFRGCRHNRMFMPYN